MAYSIFPDLESAGAKVYRNADGTCLLPIDEIHNASCPPSTYTSTCEITALPSNCDARIEARQVNAIVSELINFAACMDPHGVWDCNSLGNLCAAFTEWMVAGLSGVIISDTPPGTARDNQMWWETDTGNMFINFNDGSGNQWVQVAGVPVMDKLTIVGLGTPLRPYQVGVIDCGVY